MRFNNLLQLHFSTNQYINISILLSHVSVFILSKIFKGEILHVRGRHGASVVGTDEQYGSSWVSFSLWRWSVLPVSALVFSLDVSVSFPIQDMPVPS